MVQIRTQGWVVQATDREVELSVGGLGLLLAVATPAHVAFVFAVAVLLVCRGINGKDAEQ